jgi:glutaryl-CoA transferase
VASKSPLNGIRVIEMTEALAGPYCAMLLGDLGADVIKIERRGVGDQSRSWGPPFIDGESAYYLSVNRNKRSCALDIKRPGDLAALHKVLASADVFITNNPRLESLRRAGLDPDAVRARNPRIVYVGLSGYGHTGPKANRPGYDLIAQGEAGMMALTGEPGTGPNRFPTPMADISAGIYATIATLATLYGRDTGSEATGQFLDVALVDSQLTWLANLGGNFFATGERPARLGNLHPSITPYQPMRARDMDMIVAVGNDRLWIKFCEVLGLEHDVMNDPRFAKNVDRNRHRDELVPRLEAILQQRDAADWTEKLVAAGVPAGPINYPDQILVDEHIKARKMIVELEHPALGIVRSIGFPVLFSDSGPTYRRYPPRLGEHNEEVLGWI